MQITCRGSLDVGDARRRSGANPYLKVPWPAPETTPALSNVLRRLADPRRLDWSLFRSGREMVDRADEWRAAMIEKGWA